MLEEPLYTSLNNDGRTAVTKCTFYVVLHTPDIPLHTFPFRLAY